MKIRFNLLILVLCISSALNDKVCESDSPRNKIGDVGNRNATPPRDPSWYRLPDYILPESYELWILPQLGVANFTYEGRVIIQLCVHKETNSLVVHAKGLTIDREKTAVVAISNVSDSAVSISDQRVDTERQFYIVSFGKNVSAGNYSLSLSFHGEVVDDTLGFYRSSYENNRKTRWLGFTQFSTVFARWAFPCLDEPYMKATFKIHLGHYSNETVTGNTVPETIKEIKPGYFLTTLAKTPRMPTYLVGWAIHDFKYKHASDSTNFGLWARESMENHTFRSLEEGRKIYKALTKWINVTNPIEKMEEIAVPDFYFNAMENWGMVTFRESVVIWKDDFAPTSTIHNGLNTIAHEYAHTWFGNLVTPKFWNFAWLKEGFASFFGHFAQSLVSNDSYAMDLFAVEVLQPALLEDSSQHNRVMNGQGIGSPISTIGSMDFVPYKKGSSIIRMMQQLIGDWAFHRGLQSYVNAMKNSYATPQDLYPHLQHFSDLANVLQKPIQIREVMESWANQPAYPVLTITRNYTSNVIKVSQTRFVLNRCDEDHQTDNSSWWVPVNLAAVKSDSVVIANTTSAIVWLSPQNKSILIRTIEPRETLLCNIDQVYYYRVNYDKVNWQRLITHLNSVDYHTIRGPSRAALIDDSFNLARAGYINYSIPLNLSRYLIQEQEYGPWLAATRSFDFLNVMLSGIPDVHHSFKLFVGRLTEPIYKRLVSQGNSSNQFWSKLLRGIIFSTACSTNNVNCTNVAVSLFKDWLENNKTLHPDERAAIYCTGIRLGSDEEWYKMLRIFLHTELATEQELLIAGLGCTNNPVLIKTFLNYSLYNGSEIRKQYKTVIINAVLNGNPGNSEYVLNFISENLKKIKEIKEPLALSKIFGAVKKYIIRHEQLQKLRTIVDDNTELLDSFIEDARKCITFAENNIVWIQNFVPSVAKWLNETTFPSFL